MSDSMEIQDSKTVWVAWTNTDRTEGRGRQYPAHVAASREAAIRLGRKGGVQGCDCDVSQAMAVRINNVWLVPGQIEPETDDDAKRRAAREAKEAVMAKAKEAGLTDEDIALLVR